MNLTKHTELRHIPDMPELRRPHPQPLPRNKNNKKENGHARHAEHWKGQTVVDSTE
jgi:hypothetical protein